MKNNKCVVVDLDGTLLRINTFAFFFFFVLKEAILNIHLGMAISMVIFLILRKFRVISHSKLKKYIILRVEKFCSKEMLDKFVNIIIKKKNEHVIYLINQCQIRGYCLCLSTAAPCLYVRKIVSKFNFDLVVCTMNPQQGNVLKWDENIQVRKMVNTTKLLKINKLELAMMIADHYDDIPIMKISPVNVLVSPSLKTLRKVRDAGVDYHVLDENVEYDDLLF